MYGDVRRLDVQTGSFVTYVPFGSYLLHTPATLPWGNWLRYPLYWRLGGQVPVWTSVNLLTLLGLDNRHHCNPTSSQSLYRLSYRGASRRSTFPLYLQSEIAVSDKFYLDYNNDIHFSCPACRPGRPKVPLFLTAELVWLWKKRCYIEWRHSGLLMHGHTSYC
jgi:hypothetical protein